MNDLPAINGNILKGVYVCWDGEWGRGDSLSQKMSHKGNEKSSCIVAVLICYCSI